MSEPRPDIRLPVSGYERLCDFLAIVGLAICVALPLYYAGDLPEKIPTHFGLDGAPDAWGDKNNLIALPIIGVLPCVILAIVRFVPVKYWNIPVRVTAENAERQYRLARDMVATLLALIPLAMAGLVWQLLEATKAERIGPGFYVALGVMLGATFTIVIGYMVLAHQRR
ncbi:MAG: DUF1648 domain-containing protein [Phycisphaerales bacterium]|nr:DUF1648 domain-containing protein [Phycisphaerales bacterium]